MNSINFNDAVSYRNCTQVSFSESLLQCADAYLNLSGRIAVVIPGVIRNGSKGTTILQETPSFIVTALKISSYIITLGIVPIAMLVMKVCLRSIHKFHVTDRTQLESTQVRQNLEVNRESFAAQCWRLTPAMNDEVNFPITLLLRRIPASERENFVTQGLRLTQGMVDSVCIMASLETLANIPPPEREVFVTQAVLLADGRQTSFFISQQHLIAPFLNRIPASERENFATQGLRLTQGMEYIDICSLELLANIPSPEREVFVTQVLRLAGMFEFNMRYRLFELLQGIPLAERESFLTQALRVVEIMGGNAYAMGKLEFLARVPSVEREARVTRAINQIAIDFPPDAARSDPGTFMYRFTELLETPSGVPLRSRGFTQALTLTGIQLPAASADVHAADRDERTRDAIVSGRNAAGAMSQRQVEGANMGFFDYLRRHPDSPNTALFNFLRNAPH